MFGKINLKELGQSFLQLMLFVGVMVLIFRVVDLELMRTWINMAGWFGPILFLFIIVISQIAAPISGGSIMTLGALLFGRPVAFAISYFGVLIGCSCNFWLARKFGRNLVKRLVGEPALNHFDRQMENNAGITWSALLIVNIFTADLGGYLIGLTKLKYIKFISLLALTGLITIGLYVFLGTGVVELLINLN
ncbi:MAG: TVP38/TMEM64 family protein [Patescibacteria group bacterium]